MKTIKEKNTKDVLLHQIFEEIAEENKEIADDSYLEEVIPTPKKSKLSKIREIQKKRQWFFIALLVTSIIYMLFNLDTGSAQSEEQLISSDIYAVPKANQIVKPKAVIEPLDEVIEEAKEQEIIKKTNPIQVIEKSSLEKTQVQTQTPIAPKEPLTEREEAKKALFMQMQKQ